MKIVLAKTAYSPLLKVAGDYSCGIFSARGGTETKMQLLRIEGAVLL